LATRPDTWNALVAEARGAPDVPTTLDEARTLPFAEAVFRETVRLHPPFGVITRIAEEGAVVDGSTVAKDTIVASDLWSASRDPSVFTDPDAFRPERWLGRSASPGPLEIVQFGMGPHFCLGYHLAWLEGVQFAIALAKTADRSGVRPHLRGAEPHPIYLPTEHPPSGTRVAFVSASA
jgi:cytochrome P450